MARELGIRIDLRLLQVHVRDAVRIRGHYVFPSCPCRELGKSQIAWFKSKYLESSLSERFESLLLRRTARVPAQAGLRTEDAVYSVVIR